MSSSKKKDSSDSDYDSDNPTALALKKFNERKKANKPMSDSESEDSDYDSDNSTAKTLKEFNEKKRFSKIQYPHDATDEMKKNYNTFHTFIKNHLIRMDSRVTPISVLRKKYIKHYKSKQFTNEFIKFAEINGYEIIVDQEFNRYLKGYCL